MKKQTRIARIVKRLFNNWALKLFSLVAAFLLWLLVIVSEDPEGQKPYYNIPVKLVNTEILTDEDLVYEVLDKTDIVSRVTVTAAKTIRDELTSGDIVAEADFQNLTVANTVEIRFYSLRYNDQISDISGSNEILKLNIEEKKTKRLALDVNTVGTVANGYIINNVAPDQNRIEISGPESVIARIASANLTVDVTDSAENISTYADVELYDSEGVAIPKDNLDMNTESVRVKVEILKTKTVPIRYSVMGVPATGYLFTGEITSTPETVLIAGTSETLSAVSEIVIPEDALNITGQTENMTTNINIGDYLPEGTILADSSFKGKAAVTVYIEKEMSKNLNIASDHIRLTAVPAGYTVELEGDSLSYTLGIKGLRTEVDALEESSLFGYINMNEFMELHDWENLESGIYEAEVSFLLPDSVTITHPLRVHISITKTEEL